MIIDQDIQPIHLSKPPNLKTGDQIYVIQHPRGGQLTFSPSESVVDGEYFLCKENVTLDFGLIFHFKSS